MHVEPVILSSYESNQLFDEGSQDLGRVKFDVAIFGRQSKGEIAQTWT